MTIESVLFQIHDGLPRLTPGTEATTVKVLRSLGKLPRKARVLELGCGTGAATVALAKRSRRRVVAVDAHRPFLLKLRQTLKGLGLGESVETRHLDFARLPEKLGQFELIWAEGAAYVLGFENALINWRPFLSPGGRVVLSEPTYLVDHPHEEVTAYWSRVYPKVASLFANCAAAERVGLSVAQTIPLSAKDYKAYFAPLRARFASLRSDTETSVELAAFAHELEEEMRLFERFPEEVGYVFYVLESPGSVPEVDADASAEGEVDLEAPESTVRRGRRGSAGSGLGTDVTTREFDDAVAPSNRGTHRQLEAQIIELIGAVGLNRARSIFEQVSRSLLSVR